MTSLRVLIVEDEVLVALDLEYMLIELGCNVVGVATNTADALRLLDTTAPNLAFVDIQLTDGPTGVDIVRKIADKPETKAVFMSANSARIPEDWAGAIGLVAKPYTAHGVETALAYLHQGIADPPPKLARPPSLTLSPHYRDLWAAA